MLFSGEIISSIYLGVNKAVKSALVSCCLAHLVRSAPVFWTDSAVRVKSTAMTSSQPTNLHLKT